MDRHKKFSTISVLNREAEEVQFLSACYVLDPNKFRIIKDSWKKTDKYDARNMVKALWVHLVSGEFGIPCVYKPSATTRELRKLFSQYELLNRQIRMLKNNIQALLAENGIVISNKEGAHLLTPQQGPLLLKQLDISPASRIGIEVCLELLWAVLEKKEQLHREILRVGEPLQQEVKQLITIKGITPLTALAFLADVGDVRRFKSLRKMNAYLGLVPRVKASGGKSKSGHINRESRELTRPILSQSIYHVSNSSPYLRKFYCEVCSIMRRMLMTGEEFRWVEHRLFERKLKEYEKVLVEMREERNSA